MNHYEAAREKYRLAGVDTEAVIEKMMKIPVSLHCWQGDDVKGFDEFIKRYRAGFPIERAAVDALK